MPDNENLSLIPLPGSALAKQSPGEDRVLAAMVGEALVLVRRQQASLQAERFRIGDHGLCGPDYRQILHWAASLELEPAVFLGRLLSQAGTKIDHGCLMAIHWDLKLLPISRFQSSETLQTEVLNFCFGGMGLTALDLSGMRRLTELNCTGCEGLTELDLSTVPRLKKLNCILCKGITELDLSCVPRLTELACNGNEFCELDLSPVGGLQKLWCCRLPKLQKLDLSFVPNLAFLALDYMEQFPEIDLSGVPRLTSLSRHTSQLSKLDLSRIPELTVLDCCFNELAELDLSPVPKLRELRCFTNRLVELDVRCAGHLQRVDYDVGEVHLIQRPDQNF